MKVLTKLVFTVAWEVEGSNLGLQSTKHTTLVLVILAIMQNIG